MTIRRKLRHEVPQLNTSSLPDLIFTVLFFFMIVTHMRENTLLLHFQTPEGQQLTRLTRKSAVTHIYIGPANRSPHHTIIQINDREVAADDITDLISTERKLLSADDLPHHTISIKADRRTPMRLITQVKQALRQAGATNISYTATDSPSASR